MYFARTLTPPHSKLRNEDKFARSDEFASLCNERVIDFLPERVEAHPTPKKTVLFHFLNPPPVVSVLFSLFLLPFFFSMLPFSCLLHFLLSSQSFCLNSLGNLAEGGIKSKISIHRLRSAFFPRSFPSLLFSSFYFFCSLV